ncbi:DUF6412 domain-containing protein [Streptacidiphilus sp. N1-12]|uniref:DUF6412 domain-containing protein n=2 Tax=Streptacidiphilus alkalitolerans TaxID=3342712 RepID=A0ABV6V8I8_9ACTN
MRHLSALLCGLLGLSGLLLADQSGGSTGLVALATGVGLLLLAALSAADAVGARPGSPSLHAVRSTAVRRRAWRTAYLPQRDPDGRGRCRPRAPGLSPAAAS